MIDDTVAGYRIVRALGEGARARFFLVHTPPSELVTTTGERGRATPANTDLPTETRAIRHFHRDITTAQILTEVECLSRARGSHIVAVDDLAASGDDAPILVVRWVGAGTLRRLLRERRSLRPGEAITIIAPLVGALNRAHRSGVSIGDVSVDSIQFDQAGCPFLTEFGFAQLRTSNPTPAEMLLDETFREDRRQLARVANSVLVAVQVDREGQHFLRDLIDWLSDDANSGVADWDRQLEQRLFRIGAPEPLRLLTAAPEIAANTSIEMCLARATDRDDTASQSSEARSLFALPPWLDGQVAEAIHHAQQTCATQLNTLAAWCRPVRTRTWVLAAMGLICVLAASVVVATDGDSGPEPTELSALGSVSAEDADYEVLNPTDPLQQLPIDPQMALRVLLEVRQECLRDLSVVCLESVSPVGTPALVSDAALIEAVLAGAELPRASLFDPATSTEIQKLGDSVLFEFSDGGISKPASLLLVKGEAGWRIRSYTLPE